MSSIVSQDFLNNKKSEEISEFKFQRNLKCTRNNAAKAVENGNVPTVKEGYQYLLNVEKVNVPKYWQTSARSSSEFVEALIKSISEGYTVRLGIKDKEANTDRDCDEVYGVFLDVDYGSIIQTFSNNLTSEYGCFYYYTPSYVEGENEKHRLVFIFDRKASNYEARVIIRWLYKYSYATSGKSVDVSCLDPARLFFPSKTPDDVNEIEYTNRLPVDEFFQRAEQSISADDLNDCRFKCGLEAATAPTQNGQKKSIHLSKTKVAVNPESNGHNTEETVEESITQQIETIIYNDIYKASGEDINEVFCDMEHNFQEISPDYDDKRKGAVRCWVGLNRWTENRSGGTSFKVSVLNNHRIIYVARGSGGGEKGNDRSGNVINYWFNVFKDEGLIPADALEPKKGFFRVTIEEFFKRKGLTLPSFLQKKARQNEKAKGKTFDEIYAELEEALSERLRFNELTSRYEMDGENLEFDTLRITVWNKTGLYVGDTSLLTEIVLTMGKQNAYHPVKVYLESNHDVNKEVDVSILDDLSKRYLGTSEDIFDVYLKKTLISAVARIFQPGCKVDTVCVLQGKQGCRKSTFWEVLASEKYFNDSISFDSVDRDEKLKLNRFWFHELAELDQIFRRKDINNMRSFISCKTDRYRAPYSKDTLEYPRRSILVGTVNPVDFLNDSEGDRRFWAIPVASDDDFTIDTDALKAERDLIWSAAYKLYLDGVEWKLTSDEDKKRDEKNEEFRTSDTMEEILSVINNNYSSITIRQIWERVLFNQGIPTRAEEMRISDVLKKLKWKKQRKKHKGENFSVWVNTRNVKNGKTFGDLLDENDLGEGF